MKIAFYPSDRTACSWQRAWFPGFWLKKLGLADVRMVYGPVQEEAEWAPFRDRLYDKIISEQSANGSWVGNIGPIYVSACNLIILQLDQAYLPIYQR